MAVLERVVHSNGVVTYRSARLHAMGVVHGFSTRLGGVSEPPFDSLDLATGNPEAGSSVEENYRRLMEAIGASGRVRRQVHQVHGCGVICDEPVKGTEADALVTDDAGTVLSVRIADCVPVLLTGDGGRIVAAVHAGWRGVVSGVVVRTIEAMRERYGLVPGAGVAAIGPCISVANFEVGEEVAEAFVAAGMGEAVSRSHGVKPHVDLVGAVMGQLVAAGIEREAIDVTDRCTYRDAAEFFSFRRDGKASGRLAAVIGPRPRK
jgi:hypothetical protein